MRTRYEILAYKVLDKMVHHLYTIGTQFVHYIYFTHHFAHHLYAIGTPFAHYWDTYKVLDERQQPRAKIVGGLSRQLGREVVYGHHHYPVARHTECA